MSSGLEVAAAVAIVGAVAAALGLPARRSGTAAGPVVVVGRVAQPVAEMAPDLAGGPDRLAA
jgi:hypothetical protein